MSTSYDSLATDELVDKPHAQLRRAPGPMQKVEHYTSRYIYNPLGFKKCYNFILFFVLAQALFYFCWYNIRKIDVAGYWIKQAGPSEQYWFAKPRYAIGMQLHLGTILPGGILASTQFLPVIRHKIIWLHRINGWIVTLLLMVSNAGCLMILRRSLGGTFDTQVFGGLLVISTTVSAWLGVINIKLKQIDQHRKWMMRCWVYAASIISLRFVQSAAAPVISRIGGFYLDMPCEVLEFMGLSMMYPTCDAGAAVAPVLADVYTKGPGEEALAAYSLAFGQAGLIALTIHVVLLEVYLHLTSAESERLRKVSYERQLARGHKHPGSSGITSDRFGDAPWWQPPTKVEAR